MKTVLHWSQYNHLYCSEKYGYLLYNVETNNFAKLSEEFFYLFKKIESGEKSIEQVLDKTTTENLIKQKILVYNPHAYLYKRRMKYYFQAFDTSNLGLAVAPTTACNFICPYCYEGDTKEKTYMSEQTEQNLLSFIREHKRTNVLNLTWYGGEPLMGFNSIQRILEGIKQIKHIRLGLHNMPTNGYLLDEEVSRFFSKNPMNSIQITLDGAKEYHDKMRMLPGNKPTFDTIIGNIDTFIKFNPETNIFIRMNLTKENMHTYGVTNQYLSKYWESKKVTIYPAYVKDLSDGCKANCSLVGRNEKLDFFAELQKEYNLNVTFKPHSQCTGLCGATLINYYVIGPKGEMYKCWNDLGVKERIIGYLDQKEPTNYDLLSMYLAGPTLMDDPECVDCKILPICTGGCLWIRHKNMFEGKELDYTCCARKGNMDKAIEYYCEELLERKQKA